jgi:uncharacterized membrane protein YhaH (DUF805 family)
MSTGTLLFSFQGRVNRQPYWLTGVAIVIVMGLIFGLAMIAGGTSAFGGIMLLVVVLYIPAIWIGLAVAAKRLHDRNKPAWWLLIFYVLPGILDAVGRETMMFGLASFAISIWGLVELGFLRGTSGPNDYGPDPLAASDPGRDTALPEPRRTGSDGNG